MVWYVGKFWRPHYSPSLEWWLGEGELAKEEALFQVNKWVNMWDPLDSQFAL